MLHYNARRLDNTEHEIKELRQLPTDVPFGFGVNGSEWSVLVLY